MIRNLLSAAVLTLSLSVSAHAAELSAWSPQPEDHPTSLAMQNFLLQAKDIDGHHDLKILPISAAGDQNKLIRSLQSGDINVAVLTASTVTKLVPKAKVLQLPFLFRDAKQMFVQLDGQVGKEIEAEMAAKGMIVLGWYDGGTRSLYLRNKPPASLYELSGLKLRIPNRGDLRQMVTALGGEPEILAYENVTGALDAGSIDGAENDMLSYEADQHYKHARYFVQSNHSVQFEALVVSAVLWNHLSEAGRKSMQDAGRASAQSDRDMWGKRMLAARTRLEKDGVKFIDLRDNTVFFSHVSESYKPYIENPKTSDLLLRLMTARG
jgi:TRAP-type C4-dicarboxylate transport system substrate-binding protein